MSNTCVILSAKKYYFLKLHKPIDLCKCEVSCFLWGTVWIVKYYLDELQIQRVK